MACMKVTLLGTGTSCGVPVLGCNCKVCRSKDPRDNRLRCAALVETSSSSVLIDCGPDIRQQLLGMPFRKIDGVLITHEHYDHVGGIDDLRPYCRFGNIPLYGLRRTLDAVKRNLPYCFPKGEMYPGVPRLTLCEVSPHKPFTVGGLSVVPLTVMHGKMPILGFRIADFAYVTDMKTISEADLHLLRGVSTLVVNALRFGPPHHSHQCVDDAEALVSAIGVRHAVLIHCNHDIGLHDEVSRRLPEGISLGYDGMTLNL